MGARGLAALVALGLALSAAPAIAGGKQVKLVTDIAPGAASSLPPVTSFDPLAETFTVLGDTVFFGATHEGSHRNVRLWRSDGTKRGTHLVSQTALVPGGLTVLGDTLYFGASTDADGYELWKSDGTEEGTVLVKDINPGRRPSSPQGFTVVGDTLYFGADDGVHGIELWKSDGTEEGTTLVKDVQPGPGSSMGDELAEGVIFDSELEAAGGTLFFVADDGFLGRHLWKTDGTSEGTSLVGLPTISPDTGPSLNGSSPHGLTALGDVLLFHADDGIHGSELWRTDGTLLGTRLVKDINPAGHSHIDDSHGVFDTTGVTIGGTMYFRANDGVHGPELWRSNGTKPGTYMVKDINPGSVGSILAWLTPVGDTLFLRATDGVHGLEFWRSDGTEAGTALVSDIRPGSGSSSPTQLTAVGNTLFLFADDQVHGVELWRSDGTDAGTTLARDINPGLDGSIFPPPHEILLLSSSSSGTVFPGDVMFFAADDGVSGTELWIARP